MEPDTLCECGHRWDEHVRDLDPSPCKRPECDCSIFEPDEPHQAEGSEVMRMLGMLFDRPSGE